MQHLLSFGRVSFIFESLSGLVIFFCFIFFNIVKVALGDLCNCVHVMMYRAVQMVKTGAQARSAFSRAVLTLETQNY